MSSFGANLILRNLHIIYDANVFSSSLDSDKFKPPSECLNVFVISNSFIRRVTCMLSRPGQGSSEIKLKPSSNSLEYCLFFGLYKVCVTLLPISCLTSPELSSSAYMI